MSIKHHITIVVHNLPVPYDRRVWLEATTLVEAGYDVTVVCPATSAFPKHRETLEGVDIRRFSLPAGETPVRLAIEFAIGFVQVALQLARIRSRRRIDVLHVCNPPEIYWPLAYVLRPLGTKFLFDHHDLSPEMYLAKFGKDRDVVYRALRFLERRTYAAADAALTTNESYRRIAVERTAMRSVHITTVRSGPSLTRFTKMEKDPAVRAGAETLLVFLGEIGEQDGVEALIETTAELRSRGTDVRTLVIGDGPGLARVKELASQLKVSQHCDFVGRVSDDNELSRLLSSADIGVVPDPNTDWSRNSTMNKVMEYMFFALPIAAFDLTETQVSACDAAVYAEPDDVGALADVIEGMIADPTGSRERGERGADRLRTELAWEHSRPALLGAYADLLSREAGPDIVN